MRLMTMLRSTIALSVAVLCFSATVHAAPPTVVVSVKSLDELLDDANTIGESVGQPGLKDAAEGQISALTGGDGLAGVDRERSFGAYWSMDQSDPNGIGTVVAFIPVTDKEAFEKLIRNFVPDLKVEDEKWTATVQGIPLFGKIVEDYAYISSSEEALEELAELESITNEDYDISLQVILSNIPAQLKETYLSVVEQSANNDRSSDSPAKNPAEEVGRELGLQWALAGITAVVNGGDRLTFGLDFDEEARLASVDFDLTSIKGSDLERSFTAYSKMVPAFGAISPESPALRLVLSHPTTAILDKLPELFDAIRKSAESEIDNDPKMKDDADRQAAKDVSNRLLNIAEATLKSGALHSVLVVEEGDDDTVRIYGGTKVAKGDDAGKLLDDVLKLAKESPELANVTPDVAKHAGARIHEIKADAHDKQAEMFGDSPLHLAIRADSLWLSIGGGNLDALKAALDAFGKKPAKTEVPISLRVKPATLVTLLEKDDQGLIERAQTIAGEDGDVLNLEIQPHETTGLKIHLQFGIDLFRLAGGR